jgi:transposase
LKSDLIHADETGLYCENGRYWCFVFSNTKFTYLDINKSRSKKALDEIGILNNYTGNLETDFYAMYRKYPDIKNYFCNAHLLRELTFIHEIEGKYWGKRFMNTLLKLKSLDRTQNNFISQRDDLISSLKTIIKYNLEIETRLQEENLRNLEEERVKKRLKKKIGKKAQTPANNLLNRLNKYLDGYLGFTYNIVIPFTNNQGERDLRFIKVQQKISGTFRTLNGAKNFLKRASLISTFKKQKLNVLESLQDLLLGKTIAFDYQ